MVPGEIVCGSGSIILNEGRERVSVVVTNNGLRPVVVGSHFHFAAANPALDFDRAKTFGCRLDIPAGDMMRFEPGVEEPVTLVRMPSVRGVKPLSDILDALGLPHADGENHDDTAGGNIYSPSATLSPATLSREEYARRYGPTVGDMVRLGDTDLWVKIEKDFTTYGDELTLDLGGVVRCSMGQSEVGRDEGALDTVITNAIIIDYTGIFKADIGIRDGLIAGIGKAGNPNTMAGVAASMVVGPETQVIDAAGDIITAGTVAANVQVPSQTFLNRLLHSGVTTLIGGGSGPGTGSGMSSTVPGGWHTLRFLDSMDPAPLNFLLLGAGNASYGSSSFAEQAVNGAGGFLVHEVRGATPNVVDECLRASDVLGAAAVLVSDTLNEAGFVESTRDALGGRVCILPDVDGIEGGHVPDLLALLSNSLGNVLAGTSVASRPYTTNSIDSLALAARKRLKRAGSTSAEIDALADSQIRKETLMATEVLHDLGVIPMMTGSTMLPVANLEIPRRTWRTAHHMLNVMGKLPEDNGSGSDNFRVRRYLAKYTINPAIAHGIGHLVGSVEVGKYADLALWTRQTFGLAPVQVLKGGASVLFDGSTPLSTDQSFLACAEGVDRGVLGDALTPLGLRHKIVHIQRVRAVRHDDMKLSTRAGRIEVDPITYQVRRDGGLVECYPVEEVPLGQNY
ncbi:urease subunit beta [Streptomyces sp. TRM66268-LWL]|uniref:urease n=1 Tax=Streptomyces polyasparticus TaxID=2767826 RepID=A0ABR7SY17_9ACTN|nr:urease subunit beta [Streptomyces polyasparticus]